MATELETNPWIAPERMKKCSSCQENKPREAFYSDRSKKNKLSSNCKSCDKKKQQENPRSPQTQKRYRLKRKYNITLEQHQIMLYAQNGLCAICFNPMLGSKEPHTDHNHTTQLFRGLLCSRCNTSLHIVEDPIWLKDAQAYLARTTR